MSGWTQADVTRHHLKQQKSAKPSKYRNVKTTIDGIVFDSAKEAKRWSDLRVLEKAGEILDLKRQVSFPIVLNRQNICVWIADFMYHEGADHHPVVEDCKGVKTAVYRLKKRLVEAQYSIQIRET